MDLLKLHLDTQRRALKTLQAESPKYRDAAGILLLLNRESVKFTEAGREFDACQQFNFVETVRAAIRAGRYGDFRRIVDGMIDDLE